MDIDDSPTGWESDIQLSGCINGFRIRRDDSYGMGPCAEFNFIFSYGSQTFNAWKRFSEFEKLQSIVRYFHDDENHPRSFAMTCKRWEEIKSKQRWFRDLSISYLIEKSIYLGRYIQSLLIESDG